MRSRAVREGSVGLFFLLGLGLFAAIAVWLREAYFGARTYQAIVEFENAAGVQAGTPVRYRGVTVGRVTGIKPGIDKVNVEIKITQPDLVIPRNVKVEANQSGFIGQNVLDIIPTAPISASIQGVNPLDPNCKDRNLIVCNNERLQGQMGVSLDQFIRLYSDEKFYANISNALQNTSIAAQEVAKLSRNLSDLSITAKQQITSVSVAANSIGQTAVKFGGTADKLNRTVDQFALTANQINATANRTADEFTRTANRITSIADRTANQLSGSVNQITVSANQTANKFGTTADELSRSINQITASTNRTTNQLSRSIDQITASTNRTVDKFGATADRFNVAANQVGTLATNVNNLVTANQASLVATLDNISQTSAELRTAVNNLNPAIERVAKGELLRNLETLSANAAQTSANLRDLTTTLNNPFTLLVLQQTLDSARATFQNAQKITSDLDDLTGDPAFRNNLRNLVNGLSNLVSSTDQLQKQVEVAQFLTPIAEASNLEIPQIPGSFQIEQAPGVNLSDPLVLQNLQENPLLSSPAVRKQKQPLEGESTSIQE